MRRNFSEEIEQNVSLDFRFLKALLTGIDSISLYEPQNKCLRPWALKSSDDDAKMTMMTSFIQISGDWRYTQSVLRVLYECIKCVSTYKRYL